MVSINIPLRLCDLDEGGLPNSIPAPWIHNYPAGIGNAPVTTKNLS